MVSRRLTIVALCCLAGLGGLTAVAGAPPPTQLCGVCESEIVGDGIDGATGPETLDVYIDETGDSRWVARVPVNASAAERYEDPAALEAAVDDAWTSSHAARGDRRDVEASLEDGTVVVNYTVEDVARPGVGETWLVDYFATGTSNTRYQLAADRVTIHAPAGTVITNEPRYATVDGGAATWTAEADGHLESDFDDQTHLTYGPEGLRGTASSYATIALERGPSALERGVVLGIGPGGVLAMVGLAVGRVDRGVDAFDAAALERLLVAVGVVGAGGVLVVSLAATGRPFAPGIGSLSALGAGYAALAVTARRYGPRLETRGLVGLSVLAAVAVGATTWLLGGASVLPVALPFGLATALFVPIGYAFERGARPIGLVLVVALMPIGATAALAPVSTTVLVSVLYWLLLAPWIAAVTAFGYPLALLGRRLATTDA